MKTTTLFLLFLCVTLGLSAQDTSIKLGGKLGLNFTNISNDPTLVESSAGIGTEAGAFARIGQRLFVQPGVDYISNKVTLQRSVQPRSGENDVVRLRYFRAPVLVGMENSYTGRRRGGPTTVRFMAGPSFGYNLGVGDNNLDVRRRNLRNAQFALHGGVGISLLRFLEFDLMYSHGLTTVFNENNANGKFRNFSMTVGFRI
jgi:hypothetical protein